MEKARVSNNKGCHFAYVGCYTTPDREGRGDGITAYRINSATGAWRKIQHVGGLINPSWLLASPDGTMLYGLDANCKAWELVGKKRWLRVLRWPVIRMFADLGYMFFAKNRSTISYLVTGKRRCASCGLGSSER